MNKHGARTAAPGFSLVELLVAMTLGLVVSGAALSAYVSASRNYAQDERFARMQENARYALRVLGEDLAMADFWGELTGLDAVTAAASSASGDCGETIDVYDPATALMVNNYHASPVSTQFTPCSAITTDRYASTDVIAIKRVQGFATASHFIDSADTDGDSNTTEAIVTGGSSLDDGEVYLRSNGTSATFIDDASSSNTPALGENDWRYVPRIYFVRDFYESATDGIPSLCRRELSEEDLTETSCLAEGIEDIHYQFGIDSGVDMVPDLYTSTPTVAQMEKAISVRVYLLARSVDPDPHYTNAKTYQLGDVTVAAANDGFYRMVLSTTVYLRNTAHRSIFD